MIFGKYKTAARFEPYCRFCVFEFIKLSVFKYGNYVFWLLRFKHR